MKREATPAEMLAFYRSAQPSEHLQSRLELMRSWNLKRLMTACPAWAKPNTGPAPFRPRLEQVFPRAVAGGFPSPATAWSADMFPRYWEGMSTADYLSRFCGTRYK
jgi:hypothetical protein